MSFFRHSTYYIYTLNQHYNRSLFSCHIQFLFFSDICGDFFNGMDYGSACVLGIGMYLCVVVVTCTGKLDAKNL